MCIRDSIHIQYFIKQHQAALILDRSCYIIRRIVYGSTILPLVIAVDNSVTIETVSYTHLDVYKRQYIFSESIVTPVLLVSNGVKR